jgi:polar amino acid transport system substrate-binding protein
MKGVGYELGKELARRVRVPFEPVLYPSSGALLDGAKSGGWDIAFLGITPAREKDVDFTAPHLEVEFGYLISRSSSVSTLADVDRSGIRVAVTGRGLTDSILSRALKNAVVVRSPDAAAGIEMLKSGEADVFAGNKPSLFEMSDQLPGSRVLNGRFSTERQGIAIPKGRGVGMAYARKFIEDAKSEGLVKAAIESVGIRGAVVAPLQ